MQRSHFHYPGYELAQHLLRKTLNIPSFTRSANPLKSICSTIWNLLLAENEVRGSLVAFILVGRFRLSRAVLKSKLVCSCLSSYGNGSDGVSPSCIPRLSSQDMGITISSPVFSLYSFFMYSIVLFCCYNFLCIC